MRFRISENEKRRIETFVKDYLTPWNIDHLLALKETTGLSQERFGLNLDFKINAVSYWKKGGKLMPQPMPGNVEKLAREYAIYASEHKDVYTNFLRLEFLSGNYC